ncbi:MAG: hypothetical protein ACYSUI_05975 [Planctomycetota bacterium]
MDSRVSTKRDCVALKRCVVDCAVVITDPNLTIGQGDDRSVKRMRMRERLLARLKTRLHYADISILVQQMMMRLDVAGQGGRCRRTSSEYEEGDKEGKSV